ncbi:bifunctional glycosyltransferase family 2/GtrA family protein [Granulicoccus phenolivorans]|uniref:bifunctional glycosyltransferase family 2/GtrA family protein n=1 Tax=Granulicoccus phenolivorans TaxID=266854 RepID=UPI0004292E07|nr:bifunctional glycosyltransferase family 2/GtrA family protein [Granulicoccus phenolivorans]
MTFATSVPGAAGSPAPAATAVDIVIPVYNEERDLAASVRRLHAFLASELPYSARITIADNASTDGTWQLAEQLAAELPGVRPVHLAEKGRGRALKQVWLDSDATVLAYMDVDLSTDLAALLPLLAPLLSGHSDIAIGTRLTRNSHVVRGLKREFISRSYNLLLHGTLGVSFSDAQCGFKAITRRAAQRLLPLCEDNNWFFDTEMLVLAQRAGLRIHEVPVDWVDDPRSTVHIVSTATEDLRGIWRLGRGFASGRIALDGVRAELDRRRPGPEVPGVPRGLLGQILRFGLIGVASTLAYALLFWVLRGSMGAQAANLIALVITAVANTAANRAFTFGVRGRTGLLTDHAGGLLAFGVGLGLTSGSLVLLHTLHGGTPPQWAELVVLTVANATATLVRFLTLRLLMRGRATR